MLRNKFHEAREEDIWIWFSIRLSRDICHREIKYSNEIIVNFFWKLLVKVSLQQTFPEPAPTSLIAQDIRKRRDLFEDIIAIKKTRV